jgi:hypothetical protein
MTTFSTTSASDMHEMQIAIRAVPAHSGAFELSAQSLSALLFSRFSPSVALARVYATVPYRVLRDDVRAFVDRICVSKRVTVSPDTPVLTLLGTAGSLSPWNDRRASKDHVAIPLASAAFVQSIPMIARLMREMGGDPRHFDGRAAALSPKAASLGGLFYVEDATTAKDSEERLIIPATDFVASQRVKTVFALGTSYPNGTFVTAIVFARERVDRARAQSLLPILTALKTQTTPLVRDERFFTS